MSGFVERGRVPCVVVLLDRPDLGEHFFADGFRDLSSGDPVRRDTIFPIYSITKMMTAVALFQLIEEGKISPDDPVEKYLPELKDRRVWVGGKAEASQTHPSPVAPTIRHLLTHTSGYYYDTTADAPLRMAMADPDARPFLEPQAFLSFIATLPLHEAPGNEQGARCCAEVRDGDSLTFSSIGIGESARFLTICSASETDATLTAVFLKDGRPVAAQTRVEGFGKTLWTLRRLPLPPAALGADNLTLSVETKGTLRLSHVEIE